MIGDAWSMKIFYRELETLYAAYSRGEDPRLLEPVVQYADFAWWQSQRFENGLLASELDYWRAQLAGAPEALQIPPDFDHRGPVTYNAVNKRFDLDHETTQALRALSRRLGVTFYMILLSALAVLLSRLTDEEDILIGTPIALRSHENLQGVMGIFLNMILMRIDLSGNPHFAELAKRVRETALAAYSHHEVPLERVVQDLRPRPTAWRDIDRAPLSQIMFNMLDADDRSLNLSGTQSTQINVDDGAAKFGLTCEVQDHKSHLHIRIVHRAGAFENGTWKDFQTRFEHLLNQIARKPDCQIEDLDVLLPHEQTSVCEPAVIEDLKAGFLL
jgi:non-ribosomal peptide synthetase component F